MTSRTLLCAIALVLPSLCHAKMPSCASWPTNMALVVLKDAGITDPSKLDLAKTRTNRMATESKRKGTYRDVYEITFHEKTGRDIQVVTASDASSDECSIGAVDVYVISRKFNSDSPIGRVAH